MKDLKIYLSVIITVIGLILGGVKGYAVLQENVKDIDKTTEAHAKTLDKHDTRIDVLENHITTQTVQLNYIGEGMREQKVMNKEILKAIMTIGD